MQWRFLKKVFNSFLFYLGWGVCLQEVAHGQPYNGLLIVFIIAAYQLYQSEHRQADVLLILIVVMLGPLSDVIYSKLGLLHYHIPLHSFAEIPPVWLFFLWGLFGVNIPLFSWLKNHKYLAILCGAIGGPLSYWSAIKLGSASIPQPILFFTYLTIGSVWAFLLPSSIWLSDYLIAKLKK